MSGLTLGSLHGKVDTAIGPKFVEQLDRYQRYGCLEDPRKRLCPGQFSIMELEAQQWMLRQMGYSGVSIHDVMNPKGPTIGGRPVSEAMAALGHGTVYTHKAIKERKQDFDAAAAAAAAATWKDYGPPAPADYGKETPPPKIYSDDIKPMTAEDQAVVQRAVQQAALSNQQTSTSGSTASIHEQVAKIRNADRAARDAMIKATTRPAYPIYGPPTPPGYMSNQMQNQLVLATRSQQGKLSLGAKIALGVTAGVVLISLGGWVASRRSQ
jgi:hypothetical protein